VAVQSGKVWVGYNGTAGAFIGEIDPAKPPASAFTPQAMSSFFSVGPDLRADPSALYRVYHGSGTLTSAVTVAPNKKGGCVAFEVQEYYQGAWQANITSSCQLLGASSSTSIRYLLSRAVGGQFRIRGDFNRASGDTTNANASSAWAYFIVTS
jgi:hypothetical protein